MDRHLKTKMLASIACLALGCNATTGGARAQFVIDMDNQQNQTPVHNDSVSGPTPANSVPLLRGRVADQQNQTPSQYASGASSSAATKPVPLLHGGAVDQSSPLWIIQHKGPSKAFDLQGRTPLVAPTVSDQFQAEINRAAPLKADLKDNNWLLPASVVAARAQLQAQMDRINRVPVLMLRRPMLVPLQKQQVLGEQTPSLPIDQANKISKQIELEMLHVPMGRAFGGPQQPWAVSPSIARQFRLPDDNPKKNPGFSTAELSGHMFKPGDAAAEIAGELRRADKPMAVPDVEGVLKAQQASAKPRLDKQAALAASEIRAVFRRPTQTPADLEVYAKLADANALANMEGGISWDAWYARVAKLSEPLLEGAVEQKGSEGANTVSITVRANHRVSVSLVNASNSTFDGAVMRAYRKLDGNPALAFPVGSRRSEVTFLADNTHVAPGDISGVSSQSCTGDTEFLHSR
jgi:hypothetical protein